MSKVGERLIETNKLENGQYFFDSCLLKMKTFSSTWGKKAFLVFSSASINVAAYVGQHSNLLPLIFLSSFTVRKRLEKAARTSRSSSCMTLEKIEHGKGRSVKKAHGSPTVHSQ